jgi:hypothetical protein
MQISSRSALALIATAFGGAAFGILRRQRREASEPARVRAHRLGEVIVGPAREIDGSRDIRLVLHSRIEQRQDLEIDPRGVHLLDSKRARSYNLS